MNIKSSVIDIALQLPAPDIEALLEGRIIVATPKLFLDRGREFALYPCEVPQSSLSLDQYYRSSFLPIAQTVNLINSPTVQIKAWAKCELCQMINSIEELEALSKLTIWTEKQLQIILAEALSKSAYLFLTYLRVYLLPQPIEIPVLPTHIIGKFSPLSTSLKVTNSLPVLSEIAFTRHRQKLENREPPDYPELEELYGILTQTDFHQKHTLLNDIGQFLGWKQFPLNPIIDPDLQWIQTLADIGNSSEGHNFEKLVRRSLIKLGFSNSTNNSLNPDQTGGRGGLDFYCDQPYQVVGECKATKTERVSDGTPAQLLKLGQNHLQKVYDDCIKIIVAAGELTPQANLTANRHQMNIIRPETLQTLVELKAKYPGSIDLRDLKSCLEAEPFGENADTKLQKYMEKVRDKIQLRVHIITVVQDYQNNTGKEGTVETLSGAYAMSNPPHSLSTSKLHSILVELSSPLAGYIGRIRGNSWDKDRFYFLRSLAVD